MEDSYDYSSPVVRSQYLQARLNNKRAEAAKTMRFLQTDTRIGRDDGIFDEPHGRHANAKMLYSSPAAHMSSRSSQQSRRSSALPGTPRAMGAREMEDYVDKLSKQNFDLKLEIFHRREKAEEMERKMAGLTSLEDDYAEALELNEELVSEMDKRDLALDEAVVMITQLEARLALYERGDQRPSTAETVKSTSQPPVRTTKNSSLHTPISSDQPEDPTHISVSPDASAKMAELGDHVPSSPRPRRNLEIPSFIRANGPATENLRSLYVDGGQMIRDIPSYASILSRETNRQDDENLEVPKSPVLSELSESDFKSIYGIEDKIVDRPGVLASESGLHVPHDLHDLPPEYRNYDDEPDSPSKALSRSRNRRLARINQWVEDRAISPNPPPQLAQPDQRGFQSLGHVLHQDERQATGPYKQPALLHNVDRLGPLPYKSTPPVSANPIFSQNLLPPTPDTMLTRRSNKSEASIVQDRSLLDGIPQTIPYHTSLLPPLQPQTHVTPSDSSSLLERSSMLPREIDAYDDANSDDDFPGDLGLNSSLFGRSGVPFRSMTASRSAHSTGSGASDVYRTVSPSTNTSSPRAYRSRRRSIGALTVEQGPVMSHLEERARVLTRSTSTIVTPQFSSFAEAHKKHLQSRHKRSTTDISISNGALSDGSSSLDLHHQSTITTPVIASNGSEPTDPTPKRPQLSLRERVKSLARRNTASSQVFDQQANRVTGDKSNSLAPRKRSESPSRRMFPRRASKTASNLDDDDEAGRSISLKAAAAAAAPFLSFDINKDASSQLPASPYDKLNGATPLPTHETVVDDQTSSPIVGRHSRPSSGVYSYNVTCFPRRGIGGEIRNNTIPGRGI